MIISINRSGSFKDSLGYVLHDKGALTTERVGEVQTLNLVSDPYKAHLEMQTMADASRAMQARAREQDGRRAGASGSKSEKPAYHFSLSWHADDQPSRAHMFETGRKALKLLGLDQHQAVMVQHLDTPTHAHLHVVVSLVDADTGRVKSLYRDGYRLDRFAHQYEKDHAMTRTWNRAAKYDRENEWGKKRDPEAEKMARNAEYERLKKELIDKQEAAKVAPKEKQEARRKEFDKRFRDIQQQANDEKDKLREEHDKQLADYWRAHEPKPKLETRPSPDMLRPVQSMNAETMRTMKDMERTSPHLHPTNVER